SMLIHWAMALIILSMLFLGLSMVQSLAVWQVEAIALHKSFGVLALVLVAIRLINKLVTTSPALPPSVPKAQALAAHLTQVGLYASM
ncbi:cytochrome b/b6 domain-containing protein, partial [Pseudoalteromonas sp. 19-MNA-CIBAN-0066]